MSLEIAYIGYDRKAEILVDSMSPVVFMCKDVRTHSGLTVVTPYLKVDLTV